GDRPEGRPEVPGGLSHHARILLSVPQGRGPALSEADGAEDGAAADHQPGSGGHLAEIDAAGGQTIDAMGRPCARASPWATRRTSLPAAGATISSVALTSTTSASG